MFRHGIAEDALPGKRDADRALLDEGRKKIVEVIKMARRGGLNPSLIVSSPYLRAMQTAQLAADQLDYQGKIVKFDTLIPHGEPEGVWQELRVHRTESSMLAAGHEPLLSRLTAYLLATPTLQIEMKKATLVRIDVESFGPVPHGTLRWMITPRLAG